MRHLFIFIGIIVFESCSNKIPVDYKRSDTVLLDSSYSKDQLFVNANTWIARNFVSAKSVIDMNDKQAGRLIGKFYLTSSNYRCAYISVHMQIDCKDGKYRYEMYKIGNEGKTNQLTSYFYAYDTPPSDNQPMRPYYKWKECVNGELESLINSLKQDMQKKDNGF